MRSARRKRSVNWPGPSSAWKDNLCYKGPQVSALVTDPGRLCQSLQRYRGATFARGRCRDRPAARTARVRHGQQQREQRWQRQGTLDLTKVPAAAVAVRPAARGGGICNIASGDTGEVSASQRPSGVAGFKPTYGCGSIALWVIAFASSFGPDRAQRIRPKTRLAVHRCDAGHDPLDNTSSSRPLAETWLSTPLRPGVNHFTSHRLSRCTERDGPDPESRHLLNNIERPRERGHSVEAIELPMLDHLVPTTLRNGRGQQQPGALRRHPLRHRSKQAGRGRETGRATKGFQAEVKRRIPAWHLRAQRGYYDAYYAQGMRAPVDPRQR